MIDGTKVKDLRLAKRLSQSELASAAGISQTQLSRIEKGQGDTTTGILVAIAGALELKSVDELLCEATPFLPRKVAKMRESGMVAVA